jgi:8-oxo-dGTP pyrophosphatase MutT (NUDIX family)
MDPMNVAPARPASTVVLLRPSPVRFEVFLVRRHDNVAFMGGAYVFPGGRVDEADRAFGEAHAFEAAAIRELFEEAGILLARHPGGDTVDLKQDGEVPRFRDYRIALADGSTTLRDVLSKEGLEPDFQALHLFAHWITPEIEIKRFDTRFFVTVVPVQQDAVHDDRETTHGEWMDPADAVERCRREEIALPPPTWTTLRRMATFSTVDEAVGWARGRRVVPVQPGFIRNDQVTMLTLPGDPTYPQIDGFETPEETRFILANGRWRAVAADRPGTA